DYCCFSFTSSNTGLF
nr:immunoglobulin light chain junction region [Macaca mulatta]